ncbi:Organ specific protein [Artemisia annua]|uniref:Organ specific protein n=1 Tax=Artemisia annua TaxID=35608 RepID=A0A2U1NIY3_ARTAN|nr:Organ specific protein [Artemisia annua]
MRSISVFLFLFSILLVASLNDARLGPEEYWRSVMKDDPMPKAITDFLDQHSSKKERFTKKFDAKRVAELDGFVWGGQKPPGAEA